MTEIEIYANAELDKVTESLDLGRVEMGNTVKYTVYVKNPDKEWPISNITVENDNPELKFDIPSIIKPDSVVEGYIFWSPKIGSRKPLVTDFKINGELFVG